MSESSNNPRLILASGSPRRKMILEKLGLNFIVEPSGVDEIRQDDQPPQEYVMKNAILKAEEVVRKNPSDIVIGVDTVGAFHGHIFEKPKDRKEAKAMLKMLSNESHEVYTGICVIKGRDGERSTAVDKTKVTFSTLSNEEIEWYLDTNEWTDKAAAYAVQGVAGLFIKAIAGDFHNVVGLPLNKFYRLLKVLSIDIDDYRK